MNHLVEIEWFCYETEDRRLLDSHAKELFTSVRPRKAGKAPPLKPDASEPQTAAIPFVTWHSRFCPWIHHLYVSETVDFSRIYQPFGTACPVVFASWFSSSDDANCQATLEVRQGQGVRQAVERKKKCPGGWRKLKSNEWAGIFRGMDFEVWTVQQESFGVSEQSTGATVLASLKPSMWSSN